MLHMRIHFTDEHRTEFYITEERASEIKTILDKEGFSHATIAVGKEDIINCALVRHIEFLKTKS